jgi:hypothetical protein
MFDTRGNLKETVNMTLQTFEETFVTTWNMENSTRPTIFQKFTVYLNDFQSMVTPDFEMWIDGSFVNSKNSNPKDIDFVCFIDYNIYETKRNLFDTRFEKYGAFGFYGKNIDAYVALKFPETHKNAFNTKDTELYWLHQFSKTKADRHGNIYSKGFIKINFSDNEFK